MPVNALITKACTDGKNVYLVLDKKLKIVNAKGETVQEIELPRIPMDICCNDYVYMLSGPFIFILKDGKLEVHFFKPGMKMCDASSKYLIILGRNSVHIFSKPLSYIKSIIVGEANYVEYPFLVTSKGIELVVGDFPMDVPTKARPYKIFRCKRNLAVIWIHNMKGIVEVLGRWRKALDAVPIHASWSEDCKFLLIAKGWSAILFSQDGRELMELGMESRVEWVGWLRGPLVLTRERLSAYDLKI